VYIAGNLISGAQFPPNSCPQHNCGAYLAKLDSSGTSFIFTDAFLATALITNSIAVDSAGNSHLLSFGGSGALATGYFILNVSAAGTAAAAAYSPNDGVVPQALAQDPFGNLFVGGFVKSGKDLGATPGAFQPSFGGGNTDAFLTELDPTGTFTLYSTYIGGSG